MLRLQGAQTYRVATHLAVKGAPTIKLTTFLGKKFSFGPKNVEKNGFFGVFRQDSRLSFRKSAAKLRLSSNLQGSHPFGCRRCYNNKIYHFNGKKLVLRQKTSKKRVFWCFPTRLQVIVSQICCYAPIELKLTG